MVRLRQSLNGIHGVMTANMSLNDQFLQTMSGHLFLTYEHEKRLNPVKPAKHSLDGKLIISLTSYTPRFRFLHLTLGSLLEQTVLPDAIILWIAESELSSLPEKVLALRRGITILPCEDLRSYKKIIPALEQYPDAYIVNCDDDLYYPRDWLACLVDGAKENKQSVIARSVHRFHYLPTGELAPSIDWTFDVQDDRARKRSTDIIPIGSGGVLYPPGSMHKDVTDVELFKRLCPTSDDLWLYVMTRLNGYLPVKIGRRIIPIPWPGTQEIGLFRNNVLTNDDAAIRELMAHYGSGIFGIT